MESLRDYENADTVSIDTLMLEEIIQGERTKELSELNTLCDKVSFLHSSLLYYRNAKSKMGAVCYDAWKTLVKKIGGSPNTWKDLGYLLGIAQDDLNYIANSVKDDPADMVLKVFMQNEKATLDKIVNVLIEMQRYDILKAIEEPFCDLSQCFSKDDSGYQSERSDGQREIITFTKNLASDLPPALSKKYIISDKDSKRNCLRPPLKTDIEKIENGYPILFLTYAADGLDTALNVQEYVNNWDDTPVSVITLSNKRDEVYQNPEKFIREYFEKADFIVPIITSGYINQIRSHTPQVPSTNDNLDFKYVNFIYNLIVNHYIHATGCLNEKVRSVLPLNANVDVLREITMYPDLLPWTYEGNFDEHFKAFLSKDSSL
ncbi:uncharacterized protein [Epargyreus clarus]|uniref:uncharacterized protein n=1 Tax=Epargyreus clarus TaxID=520877 RepID=UPI003C2B1B35